MFKKEVIISNFILKNKILGYLEYIHNNFSIDYKNIFVYTIEGNKNEYIVTFKSNIKNKEKYNNIHGSTILHFKKGCLFSINALNKLIENKMNDNSIPSNNIELDWENYNNKLVLSRDNKVIVYNINKIEDKTYFFNC